MDGTRFEVLGTIKSWTQETSYPILFLLVGGARVGKSNIARTIAQGCTDKERLGAYRMHVLYTRQDKCRCCIWHYYQYRHKDKKRLVDVTRESVMNLNISYKVSGTTVDTIFPVYPTPSQIHIPYFLCSVPWISPSFVPLQTIFYPSSWILYTWYTFIFHATLCT